MRPFISRRALNAAESSEHQELNIVPYLDILMNLIIFVLLSMTGLAQFGTVNVSALWAKDGSARPLTAQAQVVRVGIFADRFVLTVPGGASTEVTRRDGSLKYVELTAAAGLVHQTLGSGAKAIVTAEAETSYEVLVKTLDALRETPEQPATDQDGGPGEGEPQA